MEVKFDIIKPNLYVVKDSVYFGIDSSDVIPVSMSVDEIVRESIGKLKVPKSNLEIVESGRKVEGTEERTEERFTVPLGKYLDALGAAEHRYGEMVGVTNNAAKLFDLGYVIAASTIESLQDMDNWRNLQKDLADPDKTFDRWDESSLVYRIDRERTLELMKKLHKELEPKIPDNCGGFAILSGYVPSIEQTGNRLHLGFVNFTQLKGEDKVKIEEAKTRLVERLKEVDGPCLSLDAPAIARQMLNLYEDAPGLISRYGDVLTSPMWRTRLFRFDP